MRRSGLGAKYGLLLALAATSCGDDEGRSPAKDGGAPWNDGGAPQLDSGAAPADGGALPSDAGQPSKPVLGMDAAVPSAPVRPVYVFTVAIPNADGLPDSYVALSRSPDLKSIDYSKMRMFQPYSGVAVIDGHVFIGDANGPFVTKYRIEEDLSWTQVTAINFGDYPLPEGETLNFYFGNFKNETTAYHHYGDDKSWRIIWNPREGKIVRAQMDTMLPAPTAQTAVGSSGNRTDVRWFKGPVVQPFHQTILATEDYGPESYVAVYDENTHAEKSVLRISNCPGLEQTTMAENGDLYIATTYNVPVAALYKNGPASCVVRLKSDGTRDPSFAQTDLSNWTNGHWGINFRYLRDGKATAHILHHERSTLDFNGPVDPEAYDKLTDAKLWELELIDLTAGTSKVISGFRPEHDVGYYGRTVTLEGHTYLALELGENVERSAMYELNTDGTATFAGEFMGEIWSAWRLR